ncbi:MAG: TRAP transporter small permease subunit [Hyphomonadaceae bacterium]|nr:TRAP transporter small permease subunit [Hyphomonadaceae bacterium]
MRLIDTLNYTLGEIIKWALPLLVLSVAFSVFALSIFGLSWTKLFESAQYLHSSVIMCGAAATLLAGQHVRVDIFHARMSPEQRALIDFCGFYALLLPVCLTILWNSGSFIALSWRIFEGSAEADGIRGEFLLKTLIPLFGLFMIMQGMAIALRAAFLMGGHPCPERPGDVRPLFGQQESGR